jgi:DNA invertase Pin-like site-specific DNA recombinase
MKAALYARVSTPASSRKRTVDGDRERQDPEVQLLKLRAYVQARGWEISKEYIDRKSGADPNRPALHQLEDDIEAGKVEAVLVVRLDRIMRSVPNFVAFLSMLENDKNGHPRSKPVALIAIDQSLDTSTPAGRLMRTIIMAVSEYEKDIIRERVLDGLAKAKDEGKQFGRPRRTIDLAAYREALKVTGNAKAAAKAIGVSYSTIRERLRLEESQKGQTPDAEKGGAVCL